VAETAEAVATSSAGASRRRRRLRWVALAVVLVLLGGFVWVASVAFQVWWVARHDDRPASDAIVVMGASQYNGTPSPVLEYRLRHAKVLYDEGVAPTIVTVGGKLEGDRFTEAEAGKAWLVAHGVPAADVVAVPSGTDTWNSLTAVDEVFEEEGWTSAVIVTDPWHSFRSRAMARDLGMDAATSPTRGGPIVQERGTEVRYVLRETGAYVSYVWQRFTGGVDGS
jgi:uncharacterized SAM-binding protein YcdF (DUF218 family)